MTKILHNKIGKKNKNTYYIISSAITLYIRILLVCVLVVFHAAPCDAMSEYGEDSLLSLLCDVVNTKYEKFRHDSIPANFVGVRVNDRKCTKLNSILGVSKNKENIRGTVNSEKLACNVSRTKSKIFEYAFCNPWDWFFTGTLDRKKYDRTNLEKFHKTLTKWVYNYNRKYNLNIKFLFIPELHSDGKSWHIHGFLYGLPESHLVLFKIGDRMGKGLAEKVKNGDKVYNWLAYAKKFGFCDLERIHNPEAVSKYITKYITQDLAKSVTEINAHQYYHSRGLKTAEVIKKGTMSANIVPDFENEYCRILTCAYDEDLLNLLLSKIY